MKRRLAAADYSDVAAGLNTRANAMGGEKWQNKKKSTGAYCAALTRADGSSVPEAKSPISSNTPVESSLGILISRSKYEGAVYRN